MSYRETVPDFEQCDFLQGWRDFGTDLFSGTLSLPHMHHALLTAYRPPSRDGGAEAKGPTSRNSPGDRRRWAPCAPYRGADGQDSHSLSARLGEGVYDLGLPWVPKPTSPIHYSPFPAPDRCTLGYQRKISWAQISAKWETYIPEECFPADFDLADPSKLPLPEVRRLLEHWRGRAEANEVPLYFKAYLSKDGVLVPAADLDEGIRFVEERESSKKRKPEGLTISEAEAERVLGADESLGADDNDRPANFEAEASRPRLHRRYIQVPQMVLAEDGSPLAAKDNHEGFIYSLSDEPVFRQAADELYRKKVCRLLYVSITGSHYPCIG